MGLVRCIFRAKLAGGVFVKCAAVVSGAAIPSRRVIPDGTVVDTTAKVKLLSFTSAEFLEFSQSVLRANRSLLKGYKELMS